MLYAPHNHNHSHCEHNMFHCKTCDVAYCNRCGKEWKNSYPQNWGFGLQGSAQSCITTGINTVNSGGLQAYVNAVNNVSHQDHNDDNLF